MQPESMDRVDLEVQGLVLCQKATKCEQVREFGRKRCRSSPGRTRVGVSGRGVELGLAGGLRLREFCKVLW